MTTTPVDLERARRIIVGALSNADDVHRGLRPRLARIAEERLRTLGLSLTDAAAPELLGPDAWELVRPDRPRPQEPFAAGVSLERLRRALDALERL